MVGVPGKYKGCNTCRARRVACDNGRPFCKKCTDYGRECGGYERETIFIVGTQQHKGRCSSHPPRNHQGSRKAKGTDTRQAEKLELIATKPWQPAWVDVISLSSNTGQHRVRFVAIQTDIGSAIRASSNPSRKNGVTLSLNQFRALDTSPTFNQEAFRLKAKCLTHLLPKTNNSQAVGNNPEGLCLFLYEQNSSAAYNETTWKNAAALADRIREPGPIAYQSFPEHHFFARVYRPSAVWAALLNRQPTFLCSPEWTVVPWELHPRTPLDDLLDIVVLLPSTFAEADRIIPLEASESRRLKARDLVSNCIHIERQFHIWYSMVHQRVDDSRSSLFWISDAMTGGSHIPFPEAFSFPSPLIGLVHVYYWAVLVSFHQCIFRLLDVIFETGSDSSPDLSMLPEMPAGIDLQRYLPTQTRILAANVCRSLDYTLQTVSQPDLLAAPLFVVNEFYKGLMGSLEDTELERMWCNGFKRRLEAKGQEVSSWLQDKKWVELKQFG
ncbi:hypothetical protein M426DRAFT_261330 [Hypoxylon sp. CI-4A]|nr:hypothetical protein M426DRAFT_261330 [Hypoxylon sp. CI-4A]